MSLMNFLNKGLSENTKYYKIVFKSDEVEENRMCELLEAYSKKEIKLKISHILSSIGASEESFEIYLSKNSIIVESMKSDSVFTIVLDKSSISKAIIVTKDNKNYSFKYENNDFNLVNIEDKVSEHSLLIDTLAGKSTYQTSLENQALVVTLTTKPDDDLSNIERSSLQDYFLKTEFPLDILKVFEDICSITDRDQDQFIDLSIIIKEYLEDENFIISDTLHFKNGNLLIFKRTHNDCITTIHGKNGNWSYSSPEIDIWSKNGIIFRDKRDKTEDSDVERITESISRIKGSL